MKATSAVGCNPGSSYDAAMITVTFVQPNGDEYTYDAEVGDTLMDVAVDNGVDGIIAQCGGGCSCCTCHTWLREPWTERLGPATGDEAELLDYALGRTDRSRLACQIRLAESMDGLVVEVPFQQG
jgi:2Fe-2S ferredoxin